MKFHFTYREQKYYARAPADVDLATERAVDIVHLDSDRVVATYITKWSVSTVAKRWCSRQDDLISIGLPEFDLTEEQLEELWRRLNQ